MLTDCFYFVQGGYFPPLFPPVTPVASSGKGKEVAATQNEAEIVNFNPTADPDAVRKYIVLCPSIY